MNNRAMDVDVRGHFLSLYERGMLRPGDLDPACMPFLQGLPKNAAGSVLDEFSSLDHTRYDMGHLSMDALSPLLPLPAMFSLPSQDPGSNGCLHPDLQRPGWCRRRDGWRWRWRQGQGRPLQWAATRRDAGRRRHWSVPGVQPSTREVGPSSAELREEGQLTNVA